MLFLRVKQKHIDRARLLARRSLDCPIALALNDKLGGPYTCVSVVAAHVYSAHTRRVLTPSKRAQKFIRAFDHGEAVKPSIFIFRG